MNEKRLNVVFFPHSANFGLAGTNRLQNIIYYLRNDETTTIANIALEDKSKLFPKDSDKLFIENYKEIYYAPSINQFAKHIFQTMHYLNKFKRSGAKNVMYFYGEIDLKNFFFVIWARLLGYKIVIDLVEDLDAVTKFRSFKNKLKYKSAVFFRKRLNWFADGFTAVSSHLLNKFQEKFPKSPFFFLPVTINKYLLYKESSNSVGRPVNLFYSGSFNEKDGLNGLLSALALVKKSGKKFKLILSGKGTDREMQNFWADVEKHDLKSEVDYKGFLTRVDYIKTLTQDADIFCMTRINSAYANAGFPFKLGEFLATGKPVIASKVGDVGKYLTENDAYLVDPENPGQIKDAVMGIMENYDEGKRKALNGKNVAMEFFDHEKYAAGLELFITDKL